MQAKSELVVLEVESPTVCQTGHDEEPEVHYKVDQEAVLAPCKVIKHVFQRTARDSPDVHFLSLVVSCLEKNLHLFCSWLCTAVNQRKSLK